MGIYKVFLLFTSALFYALGGIVPALVGSTLAATGCFFLAKRKQCNPWLFAALGFFFWGYTLVLLMILRGASPSA